MKQWIFLLFLLATMTAEAQQAMSFQDCLALALQNNLDIKSAQINEQIALYQYRASYGKLLPKMFFELDNKNSTGREINPRTNIIIDQDIKNYVGTLEADYDIFAGFSAINGIKSSRLQREISQADVAKVKNLIAIDLAGRFINIMYLQDVIVANQDQIKLSDKQLELADLKFKSGVIAESEVFKIKSLKASEELNLLTNQNKLTDNLISLKQLMNLPLETELVLIKPELNLDSNVLAGPDQYSIMRKAVSIHPSLLMSQLQTQKARTDLAIARAARYPVLSMRLLARSNYTNVDRLNDINEQIDGNYLSIVRFNLEIPIFNQFQTFSRVRTSKLQYKQAIIEAQAVENKLSKEVLKAITDTKTALKKKEASAIAFEFSQKSFEADQLKFQMGKIGTNELNTTKMIYNQSQAELIQSNYELLFNNALIKFYLGENFAL